MAGPHFQHREGTCGPECTYRRLYEGSQKSLNEMAGLQASALTRAGRLRAGIVVTLKRSFPSLFQQAEKEMGRRLSEVDDELLLAYLSSFVEPKPFEPTPVDYSHELRTALKGAGIDVPPGSMADIIDHLRGLTPGSPAHRAEYPASHPGTHSAHSPAASPTPVRVPLSALFTMPAAAEPYAGESKPGSESPAAVPLGELFGEHPDAAGSVHGAESAEPVEHATDTVEAPATWEGDVGNVDILATWTPSPVKAGVDSSVKHPGPPPAVPPPEESAKPAGVTTQSTPLRPQLFPTNSAPKSRRGSRRVRTQATPPDNLDVPSAPAPAPVPVGTSDQLLAMVGLPRPVFIRDLVATAGSRESVEAWESQCRADPATYPVRFVSAKSRHRMRGSLVLPTEALRDNKVEKSPWYRCVDAYRAARIYEMGVLFHRVVDEVISADFSEAGAVLRLNSARGLVGVVVVFDADLSPSSDALGFLATHLPRLATERLSLMAVLTTAGEERAVPALVESAASIVSGVEGGVPFPVIAARSWEYADDRGTSAVLVQEPDGLPKDTVQ